MEIEDVPMDEKAKRMRDLLSSFYSPDASMSGSSTGSSNRYASPLETINTTSFNPDQYMSILVRPRPHLIFYFLSFVITLLRIFVQISVFFKKYFINIIKLYCEIPNKFLILLSPTVGICTKGRLKE